MKMLIYVVTSGAIASFTSITASAADLDPGYEYRESTIEERRPAFDRERIVEDGYEDSYYEPSYYDDERVYYPRYRRAYYPNYYAVPWFPYRHHYWRARGHHRW